MSALAVHHLAVIVSSLERSLAFYQGVLGLGVSKRWQDATGRERAVWLALGGDAFLALERAELGGPTRADEAPGWHCVALAIPRSARAEWREKLKESGIPVFRETAFTLYVRDPDGNVVALSHYPDSVQASG